MTRDAALAASQRIAIVSPTLSGSIALKGGRIDDLTLTQYREEIDPKSPPIVLFSPSGAPDAFYAEFGWVPAAGSNAAMPGPDTMWKQLSAGALGVGHPVTLFYDNGQGLVFTRTIAVDEHYLFAIKDAVANNSGNPVTLFPYALISRHGTPQVQGYYILHEGLIGVMGDEGQQELTYKNIEDITRQTWDVTNAWLGITDKYWAATLLPDTDARVRARFSAGEAGGLKTYQTDYLLEPQTIAPGATGSANARLFAGAKDVSVVGIDFPFGPGGYNQALHLNHFDLLIDWGSFYFITKPMFLALHFFFRVVGNYGIVILLLTALAQLLFFPITNKSYATVARRRAVRPLAINEKVDRTLRGIYIAILTMVQFSLIKVLMVTIEMRHASFGWINDLSAPDPTNVFDLFGLTLFDPATLPVLGSFLHLGIWPAIVCFTMWVVLRLNRAPIDPTQKVIFNWMPIFAGYAVAGFPAGLAIFRVCYNSFSLLHQSLMLHRYGAKIQLLDSLDRTLAKLAVKRRFSDFLGVLQARGGHASINVSTRIRRLRWVRRASRITFWLSAIPMLIVGNFWLTAVLAVTAFLAVVVYLDALRLGQTLAGREFAAALATDPGSNRPIILFLRSFGIAQSSLRARFMAELGYIVRSSFSIGSAALVGDTVGIVDRRYEVEENLDDAIGLNAMFVAIGDRLASYGAAKITVKEEEWQKTFFRLASASQLIFMMPGPSASALWELSQIMQSRNLLEKTVFIMPRGGQLSLATSWTRVSQMARSLALIFHLMLARDAIFVCVKGRTQARPLASNLSHMHCANL
jgi:YidC/Oxa1 family membrane protein insertase